MDEQTSDMNQVKKRRFSLKNLFGFKDDDNKTNEFNYKPKNKVKLIKFEKKPMGFEVICVNGNIKVKNVKSESKAYDEGIKKDWIIIQINNASAYLSMLQILKDSNGPFNILFETTEQKAIELSDKIINQLNL